MSHKINNIHVDNDLVQEEEYCVETILGKRTRHSKTEYFLKWIGYSEDDNTWEPVEHLDCKELIEEFEEKFRQKKKKDQQVPRRKCSLSQITAHSTVTSGTSSAAGPSKEVKSDSLISKKICVKSIKLKNSDENNHTVDGKQNTIFGNSFRFLQKYPLEKTAERIIGATDADGTLMFLIKWKGTHEADLVVAQEAHMMCPQVVIQFYESRLTWTHPDNRIFNIYSGNNTFLNPPCETAESADAD